MAHLKEEISNVHPEQATKILEELKFQVCAEPLVLLTSHASCMAPALLVRPPPQQLRAL